MEFNNLTIKGLSKEASNSVKITFDVPSQLKSNYTFKAGQYLTLEKSIDGEKVRRAYSLCSAPSEGEFSVLVKKIDGGKFSSYANDHLSVGETIDVMVPMGHFTPQIEDNKSYTLIAAGSGITPVISSVKELLYNTNSKVDLFYLNKNKESIIFREELESLKNKYIDRLSLTYVLSRETQEVELLNGRIDKSKCEDLSKAGLMSLSSDGYFICGPEKMILDVKDFLVDNKINSDKIHFELFSTSAPDDSKKEHLKEVVSDKAKLTIMLDGIETSFDYDDNSMSILDFASEKGLDLPFSCKGGVCCTCRAKVVEGEVEMLINYALTDSEVDEGFVLTCQSFPKSNNVKVDFDEN